MGIYLGADPEFVVVDSQGKPVPAHRVKIPDRETFKQLGGPCFRDGFGAEFNPAPSDCIGLLMNQVRATVRQMERELPPDYSLRAPSAVRVDPEEVLSDAPGDVQQVGCNPSFNIYEPWGLPMSAPWTPQSNPLRMFAGHVHFCTGTHARETVEVQVRALDFLMGVPLAFIFQDESEIFERRVFYGRAGEYRLQTYTHGQIGLEYRTPGAELWRHPAVCALLINLGRQAVLRPNDILAQAEKHTGMSGAELDAVVQRAINTGQGLEHLLLETYSTGWRKSRPRNDPDVRANWLAHQTLEGQLSRGEISRDSFYAELKKVPSPPMASNGTVSRAAIQKLREIRPSHFGPNSGILKADFYDDMPSRARLIEVLGTALVDKHLHLQKAWPEFPLWMPGWMEHFAGLSV